MSANLNAICFSRFHWFLYGVLALVLGAFAGQRIPHDATPITITVEKVVVTKAAPEREVDQTMTVGQVRVIQAEWGDNTAWAREHTDEAARLIACGWQVISISVTGYNNVAIALAAPAPRPITQPNATHP